MKHLLLFALCVLSFALASCGDDVQLAPPPNKDAKAGKSQDLPMGHPAVGGSPTSGTQQPSPHGTMDGASPAGAHGTPGGTDPFADAGAAAMKDGPKPAGNPDDVVLAGEVSLDPAAKLPSQYTVYIMAVFDPKERAGAMIKRIDGSPKFPIKFEMTAKDSPFGVQKFDRPLWVRGMVSETGEAMKSTNRTTSDASFQPGTKDVKLTLKP